MRETDVPIGRTIACKFLRIANASDFATFKNMEDKNYEREMYECGRKHNRMKNLKPLNIKPFNPALRGGVHDDGRGV
jgi:hypothetical protein